MALHQLVGTWLLALITGCGAAACNGKGCGSLGCPEGAVLIPAGEFTMGTDAPEAIETERPAHRVTLTKPYCMDRTEVTMKAMNACQKAGKCDASNTYVSTMSRHHPNHPVDFVNWDEAVAFCRWKKGRLPTEAEWEFAARGNDGRLYPWGNEPPTEAHWVVRAKGSLLTTRDVGEHPKGRSAFGLDDMAGNVSEWVADPGGYYDARAVLDPVGPARPGDEPGYRTIRGAAWSRFTDADARVTRRWDIPPHDRSDQVGFRCAYEPR